MTTLLDGEISAPETPRRRSRRFKIIAALVTVVVLAAIGTGSWALVYINTYQPLGLGFIGASGPAPGSVGLFEISSDGIQDTSYMLIGPTGTSGTISYAVANDGSHSVTLLELAPNSVITSLHWAPFAGSIPSNARGRSFPVTLAPRDEIQLYVTVTQPRCAHGTSEGIDQIPIRWSAFGVHHVWTLKLSSTDDIYQPITLCPSKAAIARRDRS